MASTASTSAVPGFGGAASPGGPARVASGGPALTVGAADTPIEITSTAASERRRRVEISTGPRFTTILLLWLRWCRSCEGCRRGPHRRHRQPTSGHHLFEVGAQTGDVGGQEAELALRNAEHRHGLDAAHGCVAWRIIEEGHLSEALARTEGGQ